MTTLGTKLLSVVVVILIALGILGYVHHAGAVSERDKAVKEAAEQYQKLNDKYTSISTKYNQLKSQREIKRQAEVVKEDRIINENRDFYDGDCFDAVGLQHIQAAQSAATQK